MTRRAWTEAERQLLAAMYPHCHTADVAAWLDRPVTRCYAMAQRLGLHKDADFMTSPASGRLRPGQATERMVAGRFQAGMTPWNKGKAYHAGGRSVATQFKPGQVGSNWKPIGSLRVNADGYLDRKVTDMGAAASIEDASNCLRDEHAKRLAVGAAKHYREKANELWFGQSMLAAREAA